MVNKKLHNLISS